jgi:hypothetical protein
MQGVLNRGRVRALGASVVVALSALIWVSSASAALPVPRCSSGPAQAAAGAALYTDQTTPWDNFVPNELVPDQWIAKLYTEVLGCAPAQASYAAYDGFVRTTGCSLSTLRRVATAFLTSKEFIEQRRYDYAERLLILWRIARQSEPKPGEYHKLLGELQRHRASWPAVVSRMLGAASFGPSIPQLCSGQLYGWNADTPVIGIPTGHARGALGDATGTQLQQLLDQAKPGQTVWLEQGAVIRIGAELIVPAGVTLETVGAPAPSDYAAMARLIRTSANGQTLVGVSSGATLANVWVDGQRSNQSVGMNHNSIDVEVLGGTGTTVRDDRIDNTSGWSNMVVDEFAPDGAPCQGVRIVGNLIDGYSTKFHWYETTGVVDGRVDLGTVTGQLSNLESGQDSVSSTFGFADGISNQCGDSYIADNQIVDATDVSVVLFGGSQWTQHSIVKDNTIVNAGNSGWASMTVDPLYPDTVHANFAGATMTHNLVWTSPNAFLLVIAGIGTVPWFGADNGSGYGQVKYVDNTSGSVRDNTQMAIEVSNMSGAYVEGNSLLTNLALADLCPFGPYIGVDNSAGSTVQAPNSQVDFGSYAIPSSDEGCLSLHF